MAHPLAAAALSLALALAPPALAQSTVSVEAGEIRQLQAKAGTPAEKRALVGQTLALTDAEAKRFWPVYDAYQRRLDATNRRYARAIEEAVAPERVSDALARNLAKELNEIEDAESRARRAMHSAVVKALPGRKAIRYIQLENKLQSGYRYDVASALPLVK
jgi:Spy/CpxP family protein refolding chaperone